jgi:hypothetical protein
MGKRWYDPQFKKVDYKTTGTNLTKCILENREKTAIQTMKFKEEAIMKKAMDVMRRVMTQIDQCNREAEMEEQIL